MSSIQRRTSSKGIESWRVSYWVDGKQRWQGGFSTGESAADFKDLIDRIGAGAAVAVLKAQAGSQGAPLLSELFGQHLANLGASVEPGTVEGYRRMAARTWLPRLGQIPVDAITRDMVIDWIGWQRQQETLRSRQARTRAERAQAAAPNLEAARQIVVPGPRLYSVKSIMDAQGLLSSVLQAAVERGVIDRNAAHKVPLPKRVDKRPAVFLTPEEFQRILAEVPEHYRPFVAFLAGTGARFSEATALPVRAVDLQGGIVSLTRAWKRGGQGPRYLGGPKGVRSMRQISLGETLTAILTPLVDGREPDELVFTSVRGCPVRTWQFSNRVWHPALARSGVVKDATPHSLRHSHGSWLIALGVPLFEVSRRLGHENITTTADTYGHLDPGAISRTAGATDKALAGVKRLIAA